MNSGSIIRGGLTRRAALAAAGAVVVTVLAPSAALAANDHADLIRAFTGGKEPGKTRVRIDAPEIAENGNTVPITIAIESPMSATDFCEEVLVVADGNPRGGVCKFKFTAQSGVAEANTRIRLAETQNVIAIAKMSDGSFFVGAANVKVTIGGCGG